MEMKSLSYKSLRNTGLGMVFKCVMMVILLSVLSFSVTAQEMTVKSFKEKTFDLSASTHPRHDLNDEPCALVKVQMAAAGAEFSGNVVGNCAFKLNEYRVYMAKGSKRMTIRHQNYLPLEVTFADFGIASLESKMTYVMVVNLPVYGVSPAPTVGQEETTSISEPQPENQAFNTKRFEVNGVVFEMVYVQGGKFTMGASAEQGNEAGSKEKPAHKVTLSGYYIGKYEVTQAQWEAIMLDSPSRFCGDNLPVENVSWDDCQEFIRKLNQLTGEKFSLPTEAQWEYAARGGKSGGTKYSGSDDIGNVAWYDGNSGDKTHPVGEKSPNSLGIYDMSGNVYEWCQDRYGDYSSYSQTNPTGPESGNYHVIRGGSWSSDAWYCRVSYRDDYVYYDRYGGLGLRLCLEVRSVQQTGNTVHQAEMALQQTGHQSDPSIEKFDVNGVSFEMVKVPGGTFTMGATAEQGDDAYDSEKPAHKVTLSGYYIGKYEVTQAQWEAIMGNSPSNFKGDNLPVENISWNDCQEFIRKLNQLTGKEFSLPTEAQWEYAARGGKSGGTKYSGSNNIGNVAWYWDNADRKMHPVGEKSPNSLGIYDMSGNVYEWCQDWYDPYYYKYSPISNPTGPGGGSHRVFRGGSWGCSACFCRVSSRRYCLPDYMDGYLGFRLCLSISE